MDQMVMSDLLGQIAAIEAGADEDGVIADEPTFALAREPFGAWLLRQGDREDDLVYLVASAKRDPSFPRGSPDDVREHLRSIGAPDDAFDVVDRAEREWEEP